MRLLLLYLLLSTGCQSDAESDSDHYRDALSVALDDAAAECLEMEDDQLRGDCQTAVAVRLTERGRQAEAEAVCAGVSDPVWLDECWFSVVDAAALMGVEALSLCRHSGRYEAHCRQHALEREIFLLDIPTGAEAMGARAVGRVVKLHEPRGRRRANERKILRYLGQLIALRWMSEPFDPALCGTASQSLCRYAYWHSVSHLRGRIEAVCAAGPVTSAATVAEGMSGFTEAGAPLAQAVWAEDCALIASGQVTPEEIGAMEDRFLPINLEGFRGQAEAPPTSQDP